MDDTVTATMKLNKISISSFCERKDGRLKWSHGCGELAGRHLWVGFRWSLGLCATGEVFAVLVTNNLSSGKVRIIFTVTACLV